MREQLIRRGALRTQVTLIDWTLGIAFDRNQLPVAMINQLAATDTAVGTNRSGNFRTIDTRVQSCRSWRHRFRSGSVTMLPELSDQWPSRKQTDERCHVLP